MSVDLDSLRDYLAGHRAEDDEFAFGASVLVKEAKRRVTARYLCSIPAGVDPTPIAASIAARLGIECPRPWKPAQRDRVMVMCGERGILRIPTFASVRDPGTRKAPAIMTLVHDHGKRTPSKPGRLVSPWR